MKIISQANETIIKMLKNFKRTSDCNRRMHFCVEQPTDDGVLLFNLLTREMVLLTQEEHQNLLEQAYLKDRWLVVPENTNEKAYMDFIRSFLKRQEKNDGVITGYTIFTTMDCNARCFYCFELGRSRIPMSRETAEKVVQYIKNHCGGQKVKLSWFGGEPLYNLEVIDIICDGLRREGVEFTSSMISNGYLFNDLTVKKAVDSWNLKVVQITLDGTEATYNKIKAFIYREGSPYQTVLGNIQRLLDASVKVIVRLNMDLANAQDLIALVGELTERFGNRKNMMIYAHHLFKENQALANTYSEEEWKEREDAMCRLEQKIAQGGMMIRSGISKKIRQAQCMADNGRSVTILPDGNIGLCEHHSESEFVGHIDREGLDPEMVASWRERTPEIPECAQCFYYPECFMLRKCSNQNVCFAQHRQRKQRMIQRQMQNEYSSWLTNTEAPEEDIIPADLEQ